MAPERDLFANFERVRRNEADLDEFPPNLVSGMEFVFVETVDDVLAAA